MFDGVTVHEYDALVAQPAAGPLAGGVCAVPLGVFSWLESECLRVDEGAGTPWIRPARRGGRKAVQVTRYAGVIRAPGGFQIEVLPKIGKVHDGGDEAVRQLLIRMLSCLPGFRHVATDSAALRAARMPLLEVFIAELLDAASLVIRRGLRSTYVSQQDNLSTLRGKLLVSLHVTQNLVRADRFFTEHDEFTTNRPENRLLCAALERVLPMSRDQQNQRRARELLFAMAEIPPSTRIQEDFRQARLDRGMAAYESALAWARLILEQNSPLTGAGTNEATSLLFPMDAVFEAYVARHLGRQFGRPLSIKTQSRGRHLVRHLEQDWFRLTPDLLVEHEGRNLAVLDTKWKLVESLKANGTDKYNLSQADFYQLQAYGRGYLGGKGDVFLVFPETERFDTPLPVFEFPDSNGLRLWVVPFDLQGARLRVPEACILRPWENGAG